MIYTFQALHYWRELLAEIYADNIVIAGAHALQCHGLLIGREPTDLDIAIYQPNNKQLLALKFWQHFDQINNRPHETGYGPENIHAYKFAKDGKFIDLIIERKPLDDKLLVLEYNGIYYKVQSVEGVMEAKRKYFFERKKDGPDGPDRFVRQKDIIDFLELKNRNFNLIP